MCEGDRLKMWLDLGHHPHSDQFRDNKEEPEVSYPLRVYICEDCGSVQLGHIVDAEVLFTKDYLYESSITSTAKAHWKEFSDTVLKTVGINSGLVVDIGGNDGTLLQEFKAKGMDVLNIDPCPEVTYIAKKNGIPTKVEFWKKGLVKNADIILGTNVFAHVDDYAGFMEGVVDSLKPDGVFIFESPYFPEFLKGLEYDTVYHQHVSYLYLKPVVKLLDRYNMEIFDINFTPLHGGSFRCYIARKGQREVKPIVAESLAKETFTLQTLLNFADKVYKHRQDLMALLWFLKSQGKSIALVSSPAKGMTLLNYCGIKDNLVDFITERSKLKIGRYTPGSHIQIVSDGELVKRQPDYALLLAWNFAPEIIKNNPDYKGTWIVPLPEIQIGGVTLEEIKITQ